MQRAVGAALQNMAAPSATGRLLVKVCLPACRRDPDAFTLGNGAKPYIFSLPVPADPVLSSLLKRQLAARLGDDGVREGLNATADSFYSSQVGQVLTALRECMDASATDGPCGAQ